MKRNELQYLPLPQKYQPKQFCEVVGNPITLKIMTRLAAAKAITPIILAGLSGTGKSTLAYLLIRSLNCTGSRKHGYEPCGKCEECQESLVEPEIKLWKLDNETEILSAGRFKNGSEAIDYFRSDDLLVKGPLVVNEIDRHPSLQAFLLEELEQIPKHPVVLTTNNLEKVDSQLQGRCMVLFTERVTDDQMGNYLRSIAQKEDCELTDEDVEGIRHQLSEQNAKGQIRNALQILQGVLMARKTA